MSTTAIVFSGWNSRAVVAFCRFCTNRNIPFGIIAKNEKDPIYQTIYKKDVIMKRDKASLDIAMFSDLYKSCSTKGFSTPVLIPSTEFLNRFILENHHEIEGLGFKIPLCNESLYSQLSDKKRFEETCQKYGITVPKAYDTISQDKIPFVIKPKSYFCQGHFVTEKPKPVLCNEDYEHIRSLDLTNSYVQEFIGGKSYYILCYFTKNGNYSVYSQENLIQQHDGLSIIGARSSNIHYDKRTKKYLEMLQSLKFHGLIMIEVRDYKGELYMIEANPRLWGPSQLILDSGMDLFERFAYDNGLLKKLEPPQYKEGIKYFWLGGILETQKEKRELTFHNGFSYEILGQNLREWIKCDVYNRCDTRCIFQKEVGS